MADIKQFAAAPVKVVVPVQADDEEVRLLKQLTLNHDEVASVCYSDLKAFGKSFLIGFESGTPEADRVRVAKWARESAHNLVYHK